jgi:hypothetical protein
MQSEVKFAGFGGQGIMLIGKILAMQKCRLDPKSFGSHHTVRKCAAGRPIAQWSPVIAPSAPRLFKIHSIWWP